MYKPIGVRNTKGSIMYSTCKQMFEGKLPTAAPYTGARYYDKHFFLLLWSLFMLYFVDTAILF